MQVVYLSCASSLHDAWHVYDGSLPECHYAALLQHHIQSGPAWPVSSIQQPMEQLASLPFHNLYIRSAASLFAAGVGIMNSVSEILFVKHQLVTFGIAEGEEKKAMCSLLQRKSIFFPQWNHCDLIDHHKLAAWWWCSACITWIRLGHWGTRFGRA